MERVLWTTAPLALITFGVIVLRHLAGFVDAFHARQEPNYYDETQPTFHEKRGLLDQRDREVQLALSRSVAVGSIMLGLGMLLIMALTWT